MFVARLNQAKETAPFIRSASVTVDMSYISPRVRTLAKKIVLSRKFDRYARSQSGILTSASSGRGRHWGVVVSCRT